MIELNLACTIIQTLATILSFVLSLVGRKNGKRKHEK
jgi:hypothetical protein